MKTHNLLTFTHRAAEVRAGNLRHRRKSGVRLFCVQRLTGEEAASVSYYLKLFGVLTGVGH